MHLCIPYAHKEVRWWNTTIPITSLLFTGEAKTKKKGPTKKKSWVLGGWGVTGMVQRLKYFKTRERERQESSCTHVEKWWNASIITLQNYLKKMRKCSHVYKKRKRKRISSEIEWRKRGRKILPHRTILDISNVFPSSSVSTN